MKSNPSPKLKGTISIVQLLSMAFGLLFLVVIIILVQTNPCATNLQASTYKIVIAMSMAGIAAVIPGFFKFRYKGIASASGAIGVFAFVFITNPAFTEGGGDCKFNLSIVFYDSKLGIRLQENINAEFLFEDRDEKVTIIDGHATINGISKNAVGDSIQFDIENGAYWPSVRPVLIPPPGTILKVVLRKKAVNTEVSGEIKDKNSNPLKFALVKINGVSDTTNEFGRYSFSIPFKSGIYNFQVYVGEQLIYNRSESITAVFFPMKIETYAQNK